MQVFDARRGQLKLGREMYRGGEGLIYAVEGRADLLAKVYVPLRPQSETKLQWMQRHPPTAAPGTHATLAWPRDLLYDAQGAFLGYLMPHVRQAVPLFDVFNPRRRAQTLPGFNGYYLHRTARNLAAALAALHAHDYVVGDLNESNVLVTPTALVTLIDTDSFQVKVYRQSEITFFPCPVGKPEYTPPELQGKTFNREVRHSDHDRFGLGVLVFQLLMGGSHPYRSRWLGAGDPPPVAEKIARGWFPYATHPLGTVDPPVHAPSLETLHPRVAQLVHRCFEEGHGDPRRRPTPDEWETALAEAEKALVTCRNGHAYAGHLKTCPDCGSAARAAAAQVARPAPKPPRKQTAARQTASPPPTIGGRGGNPVPQAQPAPKAPPQAATAAPKARWTAPSPSPQNWWGGSQGWGKRQQRGWTSPRPQTRPQTRPAPSATLPPMSPFGGVRRRIGWEYVRALILAYIKNWLRQHVWPVVRRALGMTTVIIAVMALYLNMGTIQQTISARVTQIMADRAIAAPAALPAPAPLTSVTQTRVAHVDARQGWQPTGLTIEPGTRIAFEVISGQWTTQKGQVPPTGAQGTGTICSRQTAPSLCVEPLPSAPTGSLIARVGDQVFAISPTAYIIAPTAGALELRVNDGDTGLLDNDGVLTVRIRTGL